MRSSRSIRVRTFRRTNRARQELNSHAEWVPSIAMVQPNKHKTATQPADETRMGTKLSFPTGIRARRGHAAAHDDARPRTAFVLSGGGNQGVSQVGMLRALLERNIVPDVVIGTSAGALNGA